MQKEQIIAAVQAAELPLEVTALAVWQATRVTRKFQTSEAKAARDLAIKWCTDHKPEFLSECMTALGNESAVRQTGEKAGWFTTNYTVPAMFKRVLELEAKSQ